jgi:hypothetical protein
VTFRKHPTPGFWITLALVAVLVGYPLSFGPACWISERTENDGKILSFLYRPIIQLAFTNSTTGDFMVKYMMWGVRQNVRSILSIREGTIRWATFSMKMSETKPKGIARLFVRPVPASDGGGGFGGSIGGQRYSAETSDEGPSAVK